MHRFLQLFLNYGLVAAILVWAATVALMAYHLKESPWRWAFVLMSLAGLGTIGVIFWIRKYVQRVGKAQQEVGKVQ
ncbi:MAG: hypothetical protein WBB60_06975 [Nitrospira sp.]|jgi:hypothetical protein|nr:hypothetical protein [Nitrospira sp.]MCI1279883.1 hypothetical protein [Nitrospira sp.]MCS6319048.1 hypothetical protein [Nitrospira sp.]HQY59123.1 hypothetical protein [Nitrospira sp.]HRA97442.1 hypothetical protein [Nitrospira sp.]